MNSSQLVRCREEVKRDISREYWWEGRDTLTRRGKRNAYEKGLPVSSHPSHRHLYLWELRKLEEVLTDITTKRLTGVLHAISELVAALQRFGKG